MRGLIVNARERSSASSGGSFARAEMFSKMWPLEEVTEIEARAVRPRAGTYPDPLADPKSRSNKSLRIYIRMSGSKKDVGSRFLAKEAFWPKQCGKCD